MSSKSRGAVYKGEKLEDSFRFIILEVIGEEATEGPFQLLEARHCCFFVPSLEYGIED